MTIIEILIALLLATVVAAAVISFFAGQRNVYDSHSRIAETELNGQTALDTIARLVRDSGMGFVECVAYCGVQNVATNSGNQNVTFDLGIIPPVVDGTATNPPVPPAVGLRAWGGGNTVMRIPPLWIANGGANGPDQLYVAYGAGGTGTTYDGFLQAAVVGSAPTDLVTVPAGAALAFTPNDFMVLLETSVGPQGSTGCVPDRGCTLFQLTTIQGTGPTTQNLLHAANTWNPPGNVVGLVPTLAYYLEAPNIYQLGYIYDVANLTPGPAVRDIGQLVYTRFQVVNNIEPPVLTVSTMTAPNTWSAPQTLAVGIEDLQIAYGCDNDRNGVIAEGTTASAKALDEWSVNVAAEPLVPCARPDGVRITLVARSVEPDTLLANVTVNQRPAIEDRTGGAPDQFRHRVYQTVVYPRNSR